MSGNRTFLTLNFTFLDTESMLRKKENCSLKAECVGFRMVNVIIMLFHAYSVQKCNVQNQKRSKLPNTVEVSPRYPTYVNLYQELNHLCAFTYRVPS